MTSILTTIKKLLGLDSSYVVFDPDIVIYINSAFSALSQMGVGPSTGFYITDEASAWEDFVGEGTNAGDIQAFVYMKVRMAFDPPQSAFAVTAIENQIKELEWRLNVAHDTTI